MSDKNQIKSDDIKIVPSRLGRKYGCIKDSIKPNISKREIYDFESNNENTLNLYSTDSNFGLIFDIKTSKI